MRDQLIAFVKHRIMLFRGARNDYLRGYVHALEDASVITEEDCKELIKEIEAYKKA